MEKYVSIPVSKALIKDKEYLGQIKTMLIQQVLEDKEAFLYADRGEYIEVIHRYSADRVPTEILG
ncbi:MAG: hypothetical protein IKW15_06220 [Bacteroidales bacterium]|nr:hypothetical protein [Bacteroidales bacterium]